MAATDQSMSVPFNCRGIAASGGILVAVGLLLFVFLAITNHKDCDAILSSYRGAGLANWQLGYSAAYHLGKIAKTDLT